MPGPTDRAGAPLSPPCSRHQRRRSAHPVDIARRRRRRTGSHHRPHRGPRRPRRTCLRRRRDRSQHPRINGLVFITALAPDEGESVADVFYRDPPHPRAPTLQPDDHGWIWLPTNTFGTAFAQDTKSRPLGASIGSTTAYRGGLHPLLRPVYGKAKQGASFGHAKIASRALLRLGLSPQITTISTASARPVIAEAQLRSGRAASGRGGARQVKQAITTAKAINPDATIMVRGDSMFGTKKVITTCVAEGVQFSLSVSRNKPITAAIEAIDEATYTPVHYPGAVEDPDTGALISDAQVAETSYTLRLGRGRTLAVRLVVRRVKDARYPDALFPVWRHHPFMTNSALPVAEADITHRRHAIIETTFADLIDGPLAHIPSGLFAANCAWLACAVITHNLLRAAGTLAGGHHAVARGATLRRDLVNVPARFAAPARKPMLHLPAHWPWQTGWKTLWDTVIGYPTIQPRAA